MISGNIVRVVLNNDPKIKNKIHNKMNNLSFLDTDLISQKNNDSYRENKNNKLVKDENKKRGSNGGN